jgi:hypothetical protein
MPAISPTEGRLRAETRVKNTEEPTEELNALKIANNRAAFESRYLTELQKAVRKYPLEYVFGIEQTFDVAERMMDAIYRKSFNKNSRAIQATCVALGLKHTYKAIWEFLGVR